MHKLTIPVITPEEILKAKAENIPNQVIESFNKLIIRYWDGSKSIVLKDDAVNEILTHYSENQHKDIKDLMYKEHWLDIEPLYILAGWKVNYYKSDYTTYPPRSRYEFKA